MFKGKKSKMFVLIFVLSLIAVAIAVVVFVRTFCFYTISFESNCDIPMESYRVLQGFKGHDPGHGEMKKDGYYFTGWYKDKDCTTLYDFNTKIYDHVTLYAGWDDARALFYTYADDEATDDITQEEFDAMVEWVAPGTIYPSQTFTNSLGYTLVWFENADMTGTYYTEPYDFDLYYDNITLYGAWFDMQEENFEYDKVDFCNRCGKREAKDINAQRRCVECNSTVNKACYITKYKGNAKNVMIPDEINGVRVRGIERNDQKSIFIDNALVLKKVIFGESLNYIGNYTFQACQRLLLVQMKNKVKEIGRYAFYNCDNLRTVKLSNNITKIGDYAFGQARQLQAIVIPEACVSIGKCAFIQTNIKTLKIPNNVVSIGDSAFAACNNLATLTIGTSVESIGVDAFANTCIASVYIPKSVKVLGNSNATNLNDRKTASVFNYNHSLTTLVVDPQNTEFATVDNVLYNKTKTAILFYPRSLPATQLTINEQITKIEPRAFIGAKYIQELIIGSNVTEIGEEAFKDCVALKKLKVLPHASKKLYLHEGAFNNCTALTHIRLERTSMLSKSSFQGCLELLEIVIPDDTELGDGVFIGCEKLQKVVFDGIVVLTHTNYDLLFKSANHSVRIYVEDLSIPYYAALFNTKTGLQLYVEYLEMCSYEAGFMVEDCELICYNDW